MNSNPISQSINLLGFSLLQNLLKENDGSSNVLISPLSISQVLSLVANGAEGATKDELIKSLQHTLEISKININFKQLNEALKSQSADSILAIANSVWIDGKHKVNEEFEKISRESYDSVSKPLSSIAEVNKWCADATGGKITKVLDSMGGLSMVLINAIYFKGLFEHAFSEAMTKPHQFESPKGMTQVQMMHLKTKYQYKESDSFQAIQLPYKSGAIVSTIVLPAKNSSVDHVLQQFVKDPNLFSSKLMQHEVDFFLPKFKMEFDTSLNKALGQLGLKLAFTSHAEFTKLSTPADLSISDVIHKTYLEVNEKGAEAAAVTAVKMRAMAVMPMKETVMKVDRPFLFLIQHQQTNSVLFVGRISAPSYQPNPQPDQKQEL